jgi:hypothetical protein
MPVLTMALLLAGVSTLLLVALVRLWRSQSCHRGSEAASGWMCKASKLLIWGNLAVLAGCLFILVLVIQSGVNPDFVLNAELCPRPPDQPQNWMPCDPDMGQVDAVGEDQTMQCLLVPALLGCTLSLVVWSVGGFTARRMSQRAAGQSAPMREDES